MKPRTVVLLSGALIGVAAVAGVLRPDLWLRDAGMVAAALVAGAPIARRAVGGLRRRVVGIEVLVTIAVTGALIIGEVWEAAAVTFLFVLGGALEAATLDRTRRALGALVDLTPRVAVVLRGDRQVEVPADDVAVGEVVLVRPGAQVPVDGVVIDGHAALDESAVTGESVPAERSAGDAVFAGTVSTGGLLHVRATGVGQDTTLARIIDRVEQAQEAKAPAQRAMERFARWYTPGVVVLAVVVLALTRDVDMALTLLVIACPGALVISMPVTIVAGIGRAARRGILVKGGQHLEQAGRIDVVALDKTGTLTTGRLAVADVVPLADLDAADVLRWAAAAESGSEHPVAAAVVRATQRQGLVVPARVDATDVHPGLGIRAEIDDVVVRVGSARFLGDVLGLDGRTAADRQAAAGRTPLLVEVAGRVVGLVAVRDTVRPEARAAVRMLRAAGRHVVMLTGDDPRVAADVAREVGIDDVRAGLLPEDKLAQVTALAASGRVAMVGDGINDAPALAVADLGVAMGERGTAVAVETADVALMTDDLGRVVELIELARRTRRVLVQNVTIALVTVAALLAGVLAGVTGMGEGMLVHEASVLVVVLNAVRLLRVRPVVVPHGVASDGEVPARDGAGTVPDTADVADLGRVG